MIRWYTGRDQLTGRQSSGNHPSWTERKNCKTKDSLRSLGQHQASNIHIGLSHFSRVWLFATLWTVDPQAPLSMGFSKQESWRGLPCHPLGDLPDPGIKPAPVMSPTLQADSLPPSYQRSPVLTLSSARMRRERKRVENVIWKNNSWNLQTAHVAQYGKKKKWAEDL